MKKRTALGQLKKQGHSEQMFDGRPVIVIYYTFSDLNPCSANLRILVERFCLVNFDVTC